jgi:tuberous sclerosis 1
MSGLLSIISLLPIIPSSISIFLPDLFEIFNQLAAWTYPPQRVKDCELVHLQCGFHLLFNRLYGMYPCNFIEFLRNEYINKQDKTQIFNYSIRTFLDSVRIHPNLVMSTKTSETNMSRFKKMEPHDVVVECTKYAIESDRPPPTSNFLEYHNKPLEYTHLTSDLPPPHSQLASAKSVETPLENLWSPSNIVLATPPPLGTVPNTPTPTPVPIQPNYSMAMSNNHQSHGAEGSSPPQLIEAAIEATPESTPIKPELRNTFRPYQTSSQAVRNIWPKSAGNSSTPSSPMKKDSQQFVYSSNEHSNANQQYSMDLSNHPKLFRMLSDRNAAEMMQTSSEDQEVNDINSQNASSEGNGHQITEMMDYDEPETEDENDEDAEDVDTTPPLTQPKFYESYNYVRRVKRLRMYSHCLYSAGTSPADTTSYMPRAASIQRLKRYNSWPNLISSDVVIDSTKSKEVNGQQHPSSSPSDEAISAVSHFKKSDRNGNATNENLYKKIRDDLKAKPFEKVQKVSKATSTLDRWPAMTAYDILFYDTMANDEIKRKKSEEVVASFVTTTTTTTLTSVSMSKSPAMDQPQQCLSPNEVLEKYIQVSLKRNNSTDHRDHVELLALMLEFEKSRREIHAERNRRLLGKSRQIRGLELHNNTVSDQVARLSAEITNLNKKATEANNLHQLKLNTCQEETKLFSRKCNEESERNKQLQRDKESLQLRLDDEILLKRQALQRNDNLIAEIFDLKNLLEAAAEKAQQGEEHRKRLLQLESEMIIFNDARIKCHQKMEELNSLKARDIEMKYLAETYIRDIQNAKQTVELDRAELEVYRTRVYDLEQQTRHKDKAFAEQKRLIQSIQDTNEEKFRVSLCGISSKFEV